MQIALQDIRQWGNIKIGKTFFRTLDDKEMLIQNIALLNTEYAEIKISAYSLPKKWNKLSINLKNYFSGLYTFVLDCEPMIDMIDIDEVCQRKFRNNWTRTWKNIGEDLKLSKSEIALLSEFGIKLAFILCVEDFVWSRDLHNIISFYNSLLIWSVFTQSDLNFEKNSLSFLNVLKVLSITDNNEFVYDFIPNII